MLITATALEEAEIKPGKNSDSSHHNRIKPWALANGQGRYITIPPERKPFPLGNGRYKFVIVSLLKRECTGTGLFTSETAT
jgi:hypothetical protein